MTNILKSYLGIKLLNLLKRNSDTINTNLITIKIDTLQHYSPNCAMHKQTMKNTEVALVVFTDYSKEFVTIDFSILIEECIKLVCPDASCTEILVI